MSNNKLISVDRLKHYNDQLVDNIITPNLANTLQEVSENFGHSLSISGTSLSLLDYAGTTLNTVSLPQASSADWDAVTNKPSSFTPASHTHGDITNDGKIGTVSGKPIITTTGGKLSAGSFGTTAGSFCEGNDSRLTDARTPLAHTHSYAGSSSAGGAATSADKLNTDAGDSSTPVYFSNGVPVAISTLSLNTSGQAGSVGHNVVVKLNSGTTEGTDKFTFNGSADKTIDITASSIGAVASDDSRLTDARTPASHTHGNISNDGKIGTESGKPIITTTGGAVTAGSFGTTAGSFCEGNDSRLSDARTPTSHTHGNITNEGKVGSTANLPIITGTGGAITTGSFGTSANTFCEGNDSRLSDARTPTSHTHGNSDIISLDASKITTGTIDIARLPAGALERLKIVENQTARYALTTSEVQAGDTVKQTDTGVMYMVVDTSKLSSADGYVEYTAGTATACPWSGITGKPSSYTPSSHTHGNITNDGKLGTASRPVVTDANKNITTGSFGTAAGTFCEGNDSRLSDARTPTAHNQASSTINAMTSYSIATSSANISTSDSLNTAIGKLEYKVNNMSASGVGAASSSHTHGNITNDGKIGSESGKPLITTTGGAVTTGSFGTTSGTFCQGNDSRLSDARTPTDHASNKVTAMTGYSKASSVSAISTSDSLNAAIGKLEKALDGKQASGSYAASDHTHSNYLTSSSTLDASKLSGTVPSGCYTNTTYSTFVKSGSTAAAGLVPKPPTTAGTTKYLREDGTWEVPPDNNTVYTHPTTAGNKHIPSGGSSGQILKYSAAGTAAWADVSSLATFVKSGSSAAAGLVPKPSTTAGTTKYLREDGTWQVPPDNNTTYSNFVKSGSSAAAGLVPKPSTTAGTTKYLREDGTWTVPPNDNTVYTHPTTAGNKHIPSGGSSGQVLIYGGSSGTASWASKNFVPTTETANNAKFLRNDNTWQTVTPANIGAAASSHNQASSTINAMTSYSKASASAAIATTDSLNTAIGKLEYKIDSIEEITTAEIDAMFA